MSHPTRIVILIDKSYSMRPRASVVVNGFNEFLSQRKDECIESLVNLYTFNHTLQTLYEGRLISEIGDMTAEDYVPSGCTALYDSIITVLDKIVSDSDVVQTIFMILTDGDDNQSTRQAADVKAMFEQYSASIKPIFLGSNMDAILSARHMGIAPEAALHYDDAQLDVAIRAASQAVTRITTGATTDIEFSPLERETSMGTAATIDFASVVDFPN